MANEPDQSLLTADDLAARLKLQPSRVVAALWEIAIYIGTRKPKDLRRCKPKNFRWRPEDVDAWLARRDAKDVEVAA